MPRAGRAPARSQVVAAEAHTTRLAPPTAVAALGAGALAALLVPGARAGLGVCLAAVAVLIAAASGVRWREDRWRMACLLTAGLLSLAPLVRDAGWLVLGDLVVAFILVSAALVGGRSWNAVLGAPLAAAAGFVHAPAAVARGVAGLAPRSAGSALPAFRAATLALCLTVVFGALFASADAAFAQLIDDLAPNPPVLDTLPARLLVGLAAAVIAGGLALAVGRGTRLSPWPPRRSALGPVEWGVGLGAVVVLFAAFVAVQFVVLFGGREHVLETAGLTYAEYAREGFGQLLVVAVLAIGVVAASWRWARVDRDRDRLLLRGLLVVFCGLTIVIVIAALHRLDLYVDAFGATRLRVIAAVACMCIGGLIALMLIAVLSARHEWLPRASVALAAVTAVALTLANPDARIAERNVDRFQQVGRIDVAYNAALSADATSELASLPHEVSGRVLAEQRERLGDDDGWRGFNFARERARDALDW
jgi:hypothetical protein